MKSVWIFNHHALTPDMSGGTRHYDFARELIKRGYSVTIIAAGFHHSMHQELKEYGNAYFLKEQIDGIDFVWLKTRPYTGNGIGRVLNMLDYMYKAQRVMHELKGKPDIVIGSSVHLFAVYAAYRIAKKLDVPFVMEVRDIWPQTLVDMGMSKWHPFVLLLGCLEKFLYKKADKIITLLPAAKKHIEKFGVNEEDIVWISNGVDTKRFENIKRMRKSEEFIVTYAGSMGKANALFTLMEVAKELDKTHTDIRFKLIGEGTLKQDVLDYATQYKLKNIEILPAVPKNEIAQILKDSDALYLGLKDSALYRFGMSMNKTFDYLAAEVPIIFASNIVNNPVKEANAGICVPAEDRAALKDAILRLHQMTEEERKLYADGNLNYIENNFSIQFLTTRLENLLNGLVCKKK